jgi:hypothetical protein
MIDYKWNLQLNKEVKLNNMAGGSNASTYFRKVYKNIGTRLLNLYMYLYKDFHGCYEK